MENICSFEPMWKDFEADVPQKDITRIRLKSVEVFLRENKFLDTEQPPSLEYIIAASLEIVNHLLCFWQGDNPIIAKIRTIAAQTKSEPIIAVQGAIALWYTSCVSIFVRDIHQGVSSEEEITTFEDGTIIATWNREDVAAPVRSQATSSVTGILRRHNHTLCHLYDLFTDASIPFLEFCTLGVP
ncbi:hypothetical protein Trihar35433_1659 [Trichoderma harzianum]|nr:hypothetical protein Trihar35433_1659 [Trichoderma harzianum]